MVSFSCEVCNDTVIKKKLDQHTRQCHGAYFTCIDCSTTFSGFDYRNHTQCITEDEKYQKALYKGKKTQPQQVKKQTVAVPEKKKKEAEPKVEKGKKLLKYLSKDNESLYKVIKRISKDNKKSTKDILKDVKLVKKGDEFVLEF